MSQQRLVEMFNEVVVKKNASLIQHYFHPGFVLVTNGQRQALALFLRRHEIDYATSVSYDVHFDEHAWVEGAAAVGARCWLTVRRPGRATEVLEIVLIARYVNGRIHRIWELCRPARKRQPGKATGTSPGPGFPV